MHAKSGSFGDRVTHLNKLHVKHHADTNNKDMTMNEGFEIDALYFHFPNSLIQVAFGAIVLLSADAAFSLDIPGSWVPVAAVMSMTAHNLLWNTMHMDLHNIPGDYNDGLPCFSYRRTSAPWQPYIQWVFNNHVTHHQIGGKANYNIILPGPDFVMGTYLRRSQNFKI